MPSSASFIGTTSRRNLRPLLRAAPRGVRPHPRPSTSLLSAAPSAPVSTASSTSQPASSVSPAEISHFDALASSWWDPRGPSRLLHLMNPLRHDFIRSCHASQRDPPPRTGLTYLDIGCGGGIFAESAARLAAAAAVTAIDPSAAVLAVAKAHARRDPVLVGPGAKLRYLHTSVEELPVPPRDQDKADVLTLFEVVEHVDRPAPFLDVCARHVKPGGWLVLSTIARSWASWATTKVLAEDVLRIVPRGTHDWSKYLNEEELRGYFNASGGWNSPRCMGVVYVPGLGWREVEGSERIGNYFFGVRRDM